MLRSSDLLKLQVCDVCHPDGSVKQNLKLQQQKTKRNVYPALRSETQIHIQRWITQSKKQPQDYLFTRTKAHNAQPISRGRYSELVKDWAMWLGQSPSEYSTHSIRRTKPRYMYHNGEDLAVISELLGHKSISTTLVYLGIQQDEADAATLRHLMVPDYG